MSEPEIWTRIYRATLDTNIFLRALIRRGNLSDQLLSLWRDGRFVLVLSKAILAEIRDVLLRPALMRKYRYSQEAVLQLMALLTQQALLIDTPFSLSLCQDAADNPLIDCAVLGRVHFLVSYDNDLLADAALKQALFEFGVEILSPPLFLQQIQQANPSPSSHRMSGNREGA